MGRICKKFVILLGVVIIYTIFIPTLFIHQGKVIQIENTYAMPVRPIGQWDIEYVLNGTAFRELENVFDEQLNNKEKFIRFYTYVYKLLNSNINNQRPLNDNSFAASVYNPLLNRKYINKINTLVNEFNNRNQETDGYDIPVYDLTYNNSRQDQYFKGNHQLYTHGTYISYKIILNKMNNKYSSC